MSIKYAEKFGIVGDCPAMQQVYAMISQVAPSDATVLIRGGSGTGKELLAKALQRSSNRSDKPFIVVNSAALPEHLVESELFGHEKGAFTGAVNRRIGRAEAADSGTLFLDEIGDIQPQVQVKLLRFLQERTFQRVGGNAELHSDVRIIAATSRNLEERMKEGLFREDLYYRLNVFPIVLPNLSERKSDIPLLAEHFCEKFSKLHHRRVRKISERALDLLVNYSWPGNIRELENCIERSVLSATDDTIHAQSLPSVLQQITPAKINDQTGGDFTSRVEAFEREMIETALATHGGNVAAAARELNLTVRIIHYKIKKLGIEIRKFTH
ncbi:MAG: sigma-54 dependent transcriptional regulator [Victivallales bacterium]|nr:sigma-54 dependent transcriptional regulator [Victivallales bacterium]